MFFFSRIARIAHVKAEIADTKAEARRRLADERAKLAAEIAKRDTLPVAFRGSSDAIIRARRFTIRELEALL